MHTGHMHRPLEVEFKYLANDITLAAFETFCKSKNPLKFSITSGWDAFYDNVNEPDAFIRHRVESKKFNELSLKRKTKDANNFIRVEHNIELDLKMSDEQIEAFVAEFKYKYNTSVFKNCFIFKYLDHVLSYYVVYDKNLKELDRFVEIEVDEKFPWPSEQAAWDRLTQIEGEVMLDGITPRNRTKLSLFERYRRTVA
jgi:hypothetical protein